ncbi:redox-sensitive transcriptional activator SoxR [Novosphingobium album (ex Liu et al. 2023)]|uniref:Redox-sensitive transcriptional activator SoxR n=1 Tax=Novosphingobium album (ex Liu et al. 2023) TaxID=3031130 RepID=A0ABT5WJY2_9SPHN|nr:redox-sensitive transcriptional activator SoxR [Novosphingobium album (ex Liu et al. 2023)]MDE8650355.1 redox-sensitive transcriptional activator SoxR [Novosphingobium album (ex Liu et al. 2023)]
MDKNDLIPIGTLSDRTGIAVSAIRFYEDKGLITAMRTEGNQRRFRRSDIRRLSFIMIAQRLGLGLAEIEIAMAKLPQDRTPTLSDWQRISRSLREEIDARIALLMRTRTKLDECIGCGCMSLERCQRHNRDDRARITGPGPRYVLDS